MDCMPNSCAPFEKLYLLDNDDVLTPVIFVHSRVNKVLQAAPVLCNSIATANAPQLAGLPQLWNCHGKRTPIRQAPGSISDDRNGLTKWPPLHKKVCGSAVCSHTVSAGSECNHECFVVVQTSCNAIRKLSYQQQWSCLPLDDLQQGVGKAKRGKQEWAAHVKTLAALRPASGLPAEPVGTVAWSHRKHLVIMINAQQLL